jgi:TRAP-type mannitol/chloroaromatic compound transport system permease large subunit
VFGIFVGATFFALVIRLLGGDEFIESMITSIPLGPYGILALIMGMVFILGFFPGLDRDQPYRVAAAGPHREFPGL